MQKGKMKNNVYFKWIKDFNMKVKMIKHIGEKVGEYLGDEKAESTYIHKHIYG